MKNELYVSTGAFTGRINGRDHALVLENAAALECDGFEAMLFEDWYPFLDEVAAKYAQSGVRFPVVHADKHIGDLMGNPEDGAWEECLRLFDLSCGFAARIGAQKLVSHIWGRPNSAEHFDMITAQTGELMHRAENCGIRLVPENTACFNSPLENIERLAALFPGLSFTVDTRPAQFHRELDRTVKSHIFPGRVAHLHINDYKGGYMQWDALYPIPQPGSGDIDFAGFFAAARAAGYTGSITLEAPSMLPKGVDAETLNRSLDFIRKHMDGMGDR